MHRYSSIPTEIFTHTLAPPMMSFEVIHREETESIGSDARVVPLQFRPICELLSYILCDKQILSKHGASSFAFHCSKAPIAAINQLTGEEKQKTLFSRSSRGGKDATVIKLNKLCGCFGHSLDGIANGTKILSCSFKTVDEVVCVVF